MSINFDGSSPLRQGMYREDARKELSQLNLPIQNRTQKKSQTLFDTQISKKRHALPTCEIKATNGQLVKFTFLEKGKRVGASILRDGTYLPVSSDHLPEILKSIQSSQAFYKFFDNVYVNTNALSTGESRIYIGGRLCGGSPYQVAFDHLKTYILALANPFLLKDILDKMDEIANDVIDAQSGIYSSFEGIIMADDIRTLLSNYSAQIKTEAEKSLDLGKTVEGIKNDLKLLSKLRTADLNTTEPLKIFLSLPQIRTIKNDEVRTFMEATKAGANADQLRQIVDNSIKNHQLDKTKIDELLEETEYVNLTTLVKQIFKQREVKKEGIATFWECSKDFFLHKTLYLTDPTIFKSFYGIIAKAESNGATWSFTLQDGSAVKISRQLPAYPIEFIEKIKYKFLTAIFKFLSKNESFEIEIQDEGQVGTAIETGEYRLVGAKNVKGSNPLGLGGVLGLSPSYTEIEFAGKEKYKILAYYEGDNQENISSISVQKYHSKRKKYVEMGVYSTWQLGKCLVVKRNTLKIHGINHTNANDQVMIKDERDENKIKLAYLKEIQDQLHQIRVELLKPENNELLELLLDNLVETRGRTIDLPIVTTLNPELKLNLEKVVQEYSTKLKVQKSVEDLLKQIVEEANYSRLVEKEKSVLVSRTMELLKGAYEHLKIINEQHLIFLVGNTGSGKSTAANYFVGAKLSASTNHVGDRIFRVEKDEKQEEKSQGSTLPKIGESLGESETLYTRGYPLPPASFLPNPPPFITDCPGFEDTRGGDYEICTNLSIDQAVQKAKSIKALVLTIPIHAFLMDRGNPIIELIDNLKERFPEIFDSSNPKASSNVFILFTKASQIPSETVAAIEDGRRVTELVNEAQHKIAILLQNRQSGAEVDDFELENIQRRSKTWQFLRQMYSNKQVDVIDVEDQIARKELLKKYSSEKGITNLYNPAMKSRDMQAKFGKNIEMSTHTWIYIFKEYLETLPGEINRIKDEIEDWNLQIRQINQQKEDNEAEATRLTTYSETLTALINQLNEARANPEARNNITGQLGERITQITNDRLGQLTRESDDMVRQITTDTSALDVLKTKKTQLEREKTGYQNKIVNLENDIRLLSTGSKVDLLYQEDYRNRGNEMIKLQYPKSGTRETAFSEMRHLKDDEIERLETVRTSDYRGVMCHTALIEKTYKIVPTDPAIRAQFISTGVGGEHRADLEGDRFALDLGRKAAPHGKSIMYSFKTTWSSDGVLPWFKITHTIPNIDFNEAAIINKTAEINVLRGSIVEADLKIDNKTAEITAAEAALADLKARKLAKENEITQLRENIATQQLGQVLEEKRAELQRVLVDIGRMRDHTVLDARITAVRELIRQGESTLKSTQKRKRNFAIIIKSQWGVAKLLREFTNFVIPKSTSSSISAVEPSIVTTCTEFNRLYDQNCGKLEQECQLDLNY